MGKVGLFDFVGVIFPTIDATLTFQDLMQVLLISVSLLISMDLQTLRTLIKALSIVNNIKENVGEH